MSFQATAARSSRITKPRRTGAAAAMGLRRSVSSPSSASPRRTSSQSTKTTTAISNNDDDEKLDDIGLAVAIAADLNFRDVPQFIEYISSKMFDDIPDKGSGMSSSRIPEVLNFRRALPPIVTVAHIDALSASPTSTEREIAELAQAGVLRRVTIPHRGVGGDGIVLVQEWQNRVEAHPDVPPTLKAKYLSALHAHPTATTTPSTPFTPQDIATLTAAGFLTSTSTFPTTSSLHVFATLGPGPLSSLSTAGSRHASGTLAAVGGTAASSHIPGGTPASTSLRTPTALYNFSLPNTGSHIKLLLEARAHLLGLLRKRKFGEATLDALREQWDGGVWLGKGQREGAERKRARGEFAGVAPGRTKKWKAFWGVRFKWVLEECVGAGLVEVFETGSVGLAVRLVP